MKVFAPSVAVLLALVVSCDDESSVLDINVPDVPREEFYAVFHFLRPTDTLLQTIQMEGLVYYPEEDVSWYGVTVWAYFNFTDTMRVTLPIPAYAGCRREFAVGLRKHPSDSNYFARRYVFARDTIESRNDSLVVFRWPDDTSKAIIRQTWF